MTSVAAEDIFKQIRESSRWFLENSSSVAINEHALQKFATSILPEDLNSAEKTPFPLKFKSKSSELDFIGLVNLLNFGSGYRELLHAACNRGAYDTMAFGCIAAHISAQAINADFLLNLKLVDIPQLFGIPIDVDVELQPAVYTTKPSPLRPLAQKIVSVCNEVGRVCRARGWKGLSDCFVEILKDIRKRGSSKPGAEFVAEIAKAIPAFDDRYEISTESKEEKHGKATSETKTEAETETEAANEKRKSKQNSAQVRHVYFLKKAQLLTGELHKRFGASDPLFDFSDIADMT
ncbi:hypothetical protein AAMO2058_001044800, partial [Amorphochlora amoebiformis]